jgi:hypothetical protein
MGLEPNVWGPHYWFFLHTVALSYPVYPNAITKKKYYDLIQNMPLFLPVESISKDFAELLDKYPISSYLDDKESFIRWVHFIHNKINEKLEKPKITIDDFYKKYYEHYTPKKVKDIDTKKWKEKIIYLIIITGLIYICYKNY